MAGDQRKDDRVQSEIRVEYRTVGSFLSDYALNISKGGLFIHTENPLPPGTMVRIVFSLPGVPLLFDLSGRVKWSQSDFDDDDPPGMGVEFVQVSEKVRRRIENHVDELLKEVPEALREKPRVRPRIEMQRLSGSAPQRQEITQREARPLRGPRRRKGKKRP